MIFDKSILVSIFILCLDSILIIILIVNIDVFGFGILYYIKLIIISIIINHISCKYENLTLKS